MRLLIADFAIRNETSAMCKEVSYRETNFRTFHFPAVFVPGFRTSHCQIFCLNTVDTKTSITGFLLHAFGIRMFDAVTSANTAAA